jgi:hypothetical protein
MGLGLQGISKGRKCVGFDLQLTSFRALGLGKLKGNKKCNDLRWGIKRVVMKSIC